jgi:hypothetical protein
LRYDDRHHYKVYKINHEIHIVYDESNHISKEKISTIANDPDKYIWTPFVEWYDT